jgi:putative peptidoglycan lipid II flippase
VADVRRLDGLPRGIWRPARADLRIFTAAGTVAGLSIAVKAGTAVRELLVAWYFGTGDALDAYLIGYAVPYFLITLLGASLPQVLVPVYVHLRVRQSPRAASQLIGNLLLVAVLILSATTLVVAATAPGYLPRLAQGFAPEKLALTLSLALILAPTLLTGVLSGLASGILNARERFLLPALAPLISTAAVVISLLSFVAVGGIYALAYGLLIGTCIEALVLSVAAWRSAAPRIANPLGDVHLRALGRGFGPTLIGATLMASTVLIDQAMSAGLSSGSVAALNYASRLVMVPLGLTAAALGTVVLPYFSSLVAESLWIELRQTVARYLRLAATSTVPIAVGLGLLAGPLVQVLLTRGAFTQADAPAVASSLAALALSIPFYTGVILLMRVALALRLNKAIALISAVNAALNVALNAWLSSFMGVTGIALSTSVVYAISFGLLYAVTNRRLSSRIRGAVAL